MLSPYRAVIPGNSPGSISYSTGTWTPTLIANVSGGWTGTFNGTWVKIGRLVHVTGYLDPTAEDSPSGSQVLIGGFPFARAAGAPTFSLLSLAGSLITLSTGYANPCCRLGPSATEALIIVQSFDDTPRAFQTVAPNGIDTTGGGTTIFYLSGAYETDE